MNNDRNDKRPRTEADGDEADGSGNKKSRSVVADGEAASNDFSPDVVPSSTTPPPPPPSPPAAAAVAPTGGGGTVFCFDDEDDDVTTDVVEFTSESEERLAKNLAKLTLGVLSKDETIKFLASICSWITAPSATTDSSSARKFRNKQKYIASFGKAGGFFQVFLYMKHHLNDEELLRASVDVLSLYINYRENVANYSTNTLLVQYDQLKVLLDASSKFASIIFPDRGDNNDGGSTTGDSSGRNDYEIPPSSFVALRRIWFLISRYATSIPPSTTVQRSGCTEVVNACLDLLEKLPVQDLDAALVRNVRKCILTYLGKYSNVCLKGMLVDIGTRYLEFAMKHCDQADLEVLGPVVTNPSLYAFGGVDFGRTKLLPYCIKVITHHKSCSKHAICLIEKVLDVVPKKVVQKTGIVAALATTLESDEHPPSRDVTNLIKKLL